MEDSAFEAVYTGVYIIVFIAALTTALYLFNGITNFANKAYEYGKQVTDKAVIESSNVDNLSYTDSDIISYYMNYVKKDKYTSENSPENLPVVYFDSITIKENLTYKELVNLIKDKKFGLTVNSATGFKINEL